MRYNTEEEFANYLINHRGKDSETVEKIKGKLTEILNYCFPEYDGLKFHLGGTVGRNSLMRKNIEKNMAAGYFCCDGFDGIITFEDENYEVMDDNGFPYLKYEEKKESYGITRSYQMAYLYGPDKILVNASYYLDNIRREILRVVVDVRIYTNSIGCKVSQLVPDYVVNTNAKYCPLEFRGNIKKLPDVRIFANQCCDYYHEKYTDIYVCRRK